MSALIIDRPELQTWRQRAVFGALTAAFWVVWVLLWLPAITLLGWLAFGYQFRYHMIVLEGYRGFLGLVAIYGAVVVVFGGALILWAKYNHLRFRGMDRRKPFPVPSAGAVAQWFGQPERAIVQWRGYAVMTVEHDDQGHVVRVVPREPS